MSDLPRSGPERSADLLVLRSGEVEPVDRGAGMVTYPLVGRWNCEHNGVTTGVTVLPPGSGFPLHTHNVDETVLILEGRADVRIGEQTYDLAAGDTTWVAAGVPHRFANAGPGPLRIHWIYPGRHVLRTICETGETVEQLPFP